MSKSTSDLWLRIYTASAALNYAAAQKMGGIDLLPCPDFAHLANEARAVSAAVTELESRAMVERCRKKS
jgi:hypothetical protein